MYWDKIADGDKVKVKRKISVEFYNTLRAEKKNYTFLMKFESVITYLVYVKTFLFNKN